jgi:solute carrier family 25 (mitochondrial ornithine transporter) member 2/15
MEALEAGNEMVIDYKKRLDFLKESSKDILASIVGSAACVYTGQPFDTVKVRMQVSHGEFKGPIECFRKTMMGEGIPALWKGSVPALMGALSENAVAFCINGNLKRILEIMRVDKETPSAHEPFLAGGITGFCTAFVLCPSDVLKCRSQMSRARGISLTMSQLIKQTVKTQGVRGFYTGIGAQVMRDIPFYASFFGSYDLICRELKANTDWTDTGIYFTAGG